MRVLDQSDYEQQCVYASHTLACAMSMCLCVSVCLFILFIHMNEQVFRVVEGGSERALWHAWIRDGRRCGRHASEVFFGSFAISHRTWPHWDDGPRTDKDWEFLEGRPVAVERRVSVHSNAAPEVIPLSGREVDVVPRRGVLVNRSHEECGSRHELHRRACSRWCCVSISSLWVRQT